MMRPLEESINVWRLYVPLHTRVHVHEYTRVRVGSRAMASIGGDGDGPLGASTGIDGGGEAAGAPGVHHRSMGVIVRELTTAAEAAPKYDRISVDVRGGVRATHQYSDGEDALRGPDNSDASITDAHRALQRKIEQMCAAETGGQPTCIKSIRVRSSETHEQNLRPWIGRVDEDVMDVLRYTVMWLRIVKPWGAFECHVHGKTCRGDVVKQEMFFGDTSECIIPWIAKFGAHLEVYCSFGGGLTSASVRAWPAEEALAKASGYTCNADEDISSWRDPRGRPMWTVLATSQDRRLYFEHYFMKNPAEFTPPDSVARSASLKATRRQFDRIDRGQSTADLQRIIHGFAAEGFDMQKAAEWQVTYEALRARLDALWAERTRRRF